MWICLKSDIFGEVYIYYNFLTKFQFWLKEDSVRDFFRENTSCLKVNRCLSFCYNHTINFSFNYLYRYRISTVCLQCDRFYYHSIMTFE